MPESVAIDSTRHRRTQIEIIVNILEAARGGATKTALVYKSNLNFTMVHKYILLLIGKGFLEIVQTGKDPTTYETTEKGSEALAALRSAVDLVYQ